MIPFSTPVSHVRLMNPPAFALTERAVGWYPPGPAPRSVSGVAVTLESEDTGLPVCVENLVSPDSGDGRSLNEEAE